MIPGSLPTAAGGNVGIVFTVMHEASVPGEGGAPAREVEFRCAEERFRVSGPGRTTRHSFSFGPHYDPANLAFGALVAHAEDLVRPGGGYPTHGHRDLEIVTCVLTGALTHAESGGRPRVLRPGTVQVLSAGDGYTHSETVAPDGPPTRFVQAWVLPDTPGGPPSCEYAVPVLPNVGWLPLASGRRPDAVLPIRSAATLYAARPSGVTTPRLTLPDAPRLHLFVAAGRVRVAGRTLTGGDAARLTGQGGLEVEVPEDETAEVLVWDLR